MFRILRWTVLGLLLVAFAAPAVQAQVGGIDTVTPASGPDLDPNGTPSASVVTLGLSDGPTLTHGQGEGIGSSHVGEQPGMREVDGPVMSGTLVEAMLHWFLR